MPITAEKLTHTLQAFCDANLAGSSASAEILTERISRGRIVAQITWSGFDRVGITERQKLVWDYLKKALPPDELLSISMIFTRGVAEGAVADAIDDTSTDMPW